ncbi:MAG: GTP-binding protein [Lachnospiraceae bacterium]|nr:GTP-binding protein [Lachnospiraceae bacterium]
MRDLLRFITCGSVDDGKSTLIGHILYDSKLLYADQERALALESKLGSRGGEIDYSLLLDGLTEEREQGITIDVAYRYFTTQARSFIVADTPGHEEYTRNMAVGASAAELAVILIDARKGVLSQTKRHARICSLMGIRHFVFAINKMDLVSYQEAVFRKIEKSVSKLARELKLAHTMLIPVSATEGDNVTKVSERMEWYEGESLLSYLEKVEVSGEKGEKGFYLPVQRVCRPDHSFRGFQGQAECGEIAVGEEITVLPKGEKARVKSIFNGNQEMEKAFAGQALTLQLDREIDVSRGCVITKDAELHTADSLVASLIWMDDAPLQNGNDYFIKLGTSLLPGIVTKILHRVDVNSGDFQKTDGLQKNEIGLCRISLTDKVTVDAFQSHKTLGELILIDRVSFMTSACGVVAKYGGEGLSETRISEKTRSAAMGQQAVTVSFSKQDGFTRELLEKAEKKLILSGRHTYLLEAGADCETDELWHILEHLNRAGIVTLLLREEETPAGGDIKLIACRTKQDEESILAFVRKASSYDDASKEALYI